MRGARPFHALRKVLLLMLPHRIRARMVQTPAFYGEDYFDREKDPTRESGYGAYYSDQQEFAEVARLSEELMRPSSVLDIGCARGYQVRAFLQRGVDARGIDLSEHAVGTAPPELSGRLTVCDCRDADLPPGSFDLVTALETLEHISLKDIEDVVRGAARLTSRWLWATIPSIGHNDFGPDGVVGGKIRDRFLPLYERGVIDLSPLRHLMLDHMGLPIHGHLIVASFDWWTALFTRHGLARRGDLERVVNRELGMAREGVWNCFILERTPERKAGSGIMEAGWGEEGWSDGRWASEAVSLPEGRHLVEMVLTGLSMENRRRKIYRALMARAITEDGDVICGALTVDHSSLARRGGGDMLRLRLPCCVPTGYGTVVIEVVPEPGITMTSPPVLRIVKDGWCCPR